MTEFDKIPMRIGAHVSIAGGIDNAPLNATAEGCEVFQIFSRSPRGGKAQVLSSETVTSFRERMKADSFKRFYIHAPYFVNFASKNNRIRYGSINIVREELERGSTLGAAFVVTHLGSAKEYPKHEKALRVAVDSFTEVLKGYKGSCGLALENSAGAGGGIGARFSDIRILLHGIRKKSKGLGQRLGVCLDTAHTFAAGYDLRDKAAVQETLQNFDRDIGFQELRFLHLNDSKIDLSGLVDRHEHIGRGKIGSKGLAELFNHSRVRDFDYILETQPEGRKTDLTLVKKLRK